MPGCCGGGKRRNDGRIERDNIEAAMRGQAVALRPDEFAIVTLRMARERRWGLSQIVTATGYSRSQVAAVLARQRAIAERKGRP